MVKRAFAIVAHPDDIEFMMAGTLLRLRDCGWELHYMTLANGSCGSLQHDAATIARIRRSEAMAAADTLGAVFHESLCADLEIFYELTTLRKLASIIRRVAPEIVLTHPPQDYMEDHVNTCRLVLTAAFARGAPNFVVDPPQAPVGGPVTIYHAMPHGLHDAFGRPTAAEMYVDIADLLGAKRSLLAHHRSQKEWLDASQGIDSYLAHMEAMSREMGWLSGRFAAAEGWTRHLHWGYCGAAADPLAEALAEFVVRGGV